jgi:hypothetical protein
LITRKGEIMSANTTEQPTTGLLDTASDFLVGGGILTMALFPLAIPMVALLIVALLPLLVIGAAVAVIGAALAAPVFLARGVWRRIAPVAGRRRERRVIRGSRTVMGAHG